MTFYTYNISCISSRADDVIDILMVSRIDSFIAYQDRISVVTCEESYSREYNRYVSQILSRDLKSSCLSIINWDNDQLSYDLYSNGDLVDSYESNPDDTGKVVPPPPPYGGAPEILCHVFEAVGLEDEVSSVLRWYRYGGLEKEDMEEFDRFVNSEERENDRFPDEMARHKCLVDLLNLPKFTTSFLYKELLNGDDQDESLDLDSVIHLCF